MCRGRICDTGISEVSQAEYPVLTMDAYESLMADRALSLGIAAIPWLLIKWQWICEFIVVIVERVPGARCCSEMSQRGPLQFFRFGKAAGRRLFLLP